MDPAFWKQRWLENKIGFHLDEVNPYLIEQWPRLDVPAPARIFVPLCGKSVDMAWLAMQGYDIEAVELSELAVEQFFEEQQIDCERTETGEWIVYQSRPRPDRGNIRIWCGDFFEVTREQLGYIDAVYDRAALIALPADKRGPYVEQLLALTGPVPQFLVTLNYPQEQMAGPPFAVPYSEVNILYRDAYGEQGAELPGPDVEIDVLPGHGKFAERGLKALSECVYLLQASKK
jgi:thiopurine S-methyltransferase